MKKFLVVLMLLAVASLSFSVGGSLYMRYNADGSVTATEWGLLDDLRVGRRGTGFDLNFDNFTLSYKLRSGVGCDGAIANAIGGVVIDSVTMGANNAPANRNYIGTPTMTSPGYVQLSGLKVGPANMSVGFALWHYDYSASKKVEPTSGTAVDASAKAGQNVLAFDFTFDLPIGDNMRFHIDPWDKVNLAFGFGDADVKWDSNTNTASYNKFNLVLPLHFDMNFETVGIEIFPKVVLDNSSSKQALSSGTTNDTTSSSLTLGAMVRLNVLINELLGAFAHVGFVYGDSLTITNATSGTNTNGQTFMEAPIFAGLTVKPAGPILLTLGVGYLVELGETPKGAQATTNQPAGGLIGEYGYFDQHGYKNPFLRFAGSAKFASDWEIGMSTILYWNTQRIATGEAWKGAFLNYYYGGVATTSTAKTTSYYSEILHFDYFNSWDRGGAGFGANYLQFSKDNVTIRGVLSDASGLAGLFGFVDVSFAF